MKARRLAAGIALGVALGASLASAQPRPGRALRTCEAHLPEGVPPPSLKESLPSKGVAGYATHLTVELDLQKGDVVLPEGFRPTAGSEASRALRARGFVVPDPDGGAPPSVEVREEGEASRVKLAIPLVPLPDKPGRVTLELPPLPIAIQRASGSVITVCTQPHTIQIEDPTANETDPKVQPSPDGRPQREEWTLLKHALVAAVIAFFVVATTALILAIWFRRPELEEYVPGTPPWVLAIEELEDLQRSPLLETAPDQHFDLVSDCVRKYLGARYGFDGLEATTDEVRARLRRVRPPVPQQKEIGRMLEECDLVKFARVEPVREDCVELLSRSQQIVRATIPPAELPHLDQDRRKWREERAREEREQRKKRKKAPAKAEAGA